MIVFKILIETQVLSLNFINYKMNLIEFTIKQTLIEFV